MKRLNIAMAVIGAAGVIFFAYCAYSDTTNTADLAAGSIPFAVLFLAGYLGELIRRK